MSLLERRRALLETAKDAKEGGGINDGKYVVIRYQGNTYQNVVNLSASIDYGRSFARPSSNQVQGDLNCAEYLNSNGDFIYYPQYPSSACTASFIPLSTVSSTSDIVNCTTGSIENATATNLRPGAWCFSTDTTRAIRLGLLRFDYAASNLEIGSYLNNTYSLEQQLKLPRWAQRTILSSTNGPYLKFNSDTLKIGFLGKNARASIGIAGPITCSFTRDGGLNWTDVKDIIYDNSQSLGEHGFISSHISNNGKNIGIVYQPENSEPKLIVSNDYGNTFNSVNIPQGESYLGNFETSAKFKTWYLSSYNNVSGGISASLWKSVDQGQTWTRSAYRGYVTDSKHPCSQPCFHCDDSGKNLVQVGFASVNKKYYFATSCSLDGGETWTGIMSHELSEAGMKKFNFYMSRDSYNIQ